MAFGTLDVPAYIRSTSQHTECPMSSHIESETKQLTDEEVCFITEVLGDRLDRFIFQRGTILSSPEPINLFVSMAPRL